MYNYTGIRGVSNLYRAITPVNESVINDVVSKWSEKADIKLESITAGISFMVCNHLVDERVNMYNIGPYITDFILMF